MNDRIAILFAREAEMKQAKPSEAVLQTCDMFLNMKQDNKPLFVERSAPRD